MATWVEDIVQALTNLGGSGTLAEIYHQVAEIRTEPLPPTWQASIRERIESHSSDSKYFKGKDYFKKIDKGVWALRELNFEGIRSNNNENEQRPFAQRKQTLEAGSRSEQPRTWVEDIIQALKNLGGQARLKDIYDEVCRIRIAPIPMNGRSSTASRIISFSSDSTYFQGKADIFTRVGDGVWALRDINVDYHEAVWQYKQGAAPRPRKAASSPNTINKSSTPLEEIENIHNTIQQYREYAEPGTSEWEGYIKDLFNVLGFGIREYMRISNGSGNEFPIWFASPLEMVHTYVAVLGIIGKEYLLDEFCPGIRLSIILNTFNNNNGNSGKKNTWVIITDGYRIKILEFRKAPTGQVMYENLDFDGMITREFGPSFVKFYNILTKIRTSHPEANRY